VLADRIYGRDWNASVVVSGRRPPLTEWALSNDFITAGLRAKAASVGLYLEVWRRSGPHDLIAVVFKGTQFFSLRDWKSNVRWFWRLIPRFVPKYHDQYTVICDEFCAEFAAWVTTACDSQVRLIAAGHSLGGGLAQQFAYALPPLKASDGGEIRICAVYAFDPSPVTGWYSVNSETRERNARGLKTDRIFEHGEILAYFRLLLSYVMPPSGRDPAIREIRVNFDPDNWLILSHMMDLLADGLAKAAGQEVDVREPVAARGFRRFFGFGSRLQSGSRTEG
jgi:pimeloyl-ACP methyl ester carboxylesterase